MWETLQRRAVLGLGAAGLVAASIALLAAPTRAAAVSAPRYPTYAPKDPAAIVARVAPRDPHEVGLREILRAQPERVDVAVQLARGDIQRARSLSDPRYLGRAQATLARWWTAQQPPPDVLLLRATIRQSLHDFTSARADLERLLVLRPTDAQAHLTLAVVATVTADFAAAREHCARVAELAPPLVATTCLAQVDGVTGHAADARAALTSALARPADPALRGWAVTALAELAIVEGDYAAATAAFTEALALDPEDAYARAGLADVLLWSGHAADASTLLAGREAIDNLLVRRAIAEHAARGPEAAKWTRAMRARIVAAAERGDRIHVREEARFVLEVEGNAPRALALAKENWAVQKELADARLYAAAARLARDGDALAELRAWAAEHHVEDAQLRASLGAA